MKKVQKLINVALRLFQILDYLVNFEARQVPLKASAIPFKGAILLLIIKLDIQPAKSVPNSANFHNLLSRVVFCKVIDFASCSEIKKKNESM